MSQAPEEVVRLVEAHNDVIHEGTIKVREATTAPAGKSAIQRQIVATDR